ncbi:DUF2806 domain-containing protein [Hyunsoonleella pacifica]|uniref:DUF2806 domain-containing protein n=1 Tax=Hyunsoonleella pacifica TaxID=1080224 RepID=A0A4Q9FLU2_9FLAO|nr:DUF2806 domain-containing protein [Hyunsoonleella pacifica]TBN14347.1 DUF2806 domain-containing protein [Hyunsoonleella pacifica]GGD12969.1 hypothetical protein GCM10011368_13720 [Hyunsoonleella pacifica]
MSDFSLEKLAEPITKLIETIGTAVGIWYEPTKIKRKAKADAEAIKILARAKVEALVIEDSSIKNYYLALEQERLLLEFQKKNNRDNVIIMAAEELDGKTVNKEKVDKDWVTQFIGHVESTSNEEMQLLWAKLLSGEVQKPNSFSKRAMATLASMSHQEAKVFYEIAVLSFKNEMGDVVSPTLNSKYFSGFNYTRERDSISILQTLNLLNDNIGKPQGLLYKVKEGMDSVWIPYFDYGIKITCKDSDFRWLSLNGLIFTHIGKELVQLVSPNQDMEGYLRTMVTQIVGWHSSPSYPNYRLLIAEFGKLQDYDEESNTFENSEMISWKDFTNE